MLVFELTIHLTIHPSLRKHTTCIYIAVSKYERMNPNAATRLELTQPHLPTRQPKASASLLPFFSGCKVIHALAVCRNHLQIPSNSTVFLTSVTRSLQSSQMASSQGSKALVDLSSQLGHHSNIIPRSSHHKLPVRSCQST